MPASERPEGEGGITARPLGTPLRPVSAGGPHLANEIPDEAGSSGISLFHHDGPQPAYRPRSGAGAGGGGGGGGAGQASVARITVPSGQVCVAGGAGGGGGGGGGATPAKL